MITEDLISDHKGPFGTPPRATHGILHNSATIVNALRASATIALQAGVGPAIYKGIQLNT